MLKNDIGSKIGKIHYLIRSALNGATENSDYGNDSILREYIEDKSIKIRGRIQHGWAVASVGKTYYLNDLLPSYLWSTESQEHANSLGWKNVNTIGAPWLYLLENLKSNGFMAKQKASSSTELTRLWVFGAHSNLVNEVGLEEISKFLELAQEDSRKCRVIVLLSYLDYETYKILLGTEYTNLDIKTLGVRRGGSSSNAHLYNLFHLLNESDEVVIDHPSTLVLYALSMRKKVFWLRNSAFVQTISVLESMKDKKIVSIMNGEINSVNDLETYALEQLGFENIKSKSELRCLIKKNNNLFMIVTKMFVSIIRKKLF
jgi:hypothetical protein